MQMPCELLEGLLARLAAAQLSPPLRALGTEWAKGLVIDLGHRDGSKVGLSRSHCNSGEPKELLWAD